MMVAIKLIVTFLVFHFAAGVPHFSEDSVKDFRQELPYSTQQLDVDPTTVHYDMAEYLFLLGNECARVLSLFASKLEKLYNGARYDVLRTGNTQPLG